MMVSDKILGLLPPDLAWQTTIGDLPSTKENTICMIEYSSDINTEYFGMRNASTMFQPIIKFVIRNNSYETATEYVDILKECLHRYVEQGIMNVIMVGSPMYLGRSSEKLHEFQITFRVQFFDSKDL